jgi:hypothetical protein
MSMTGPSMAASPGSEKVPKDHPKGYRNYWLVCDAKIHICGLAKAVGD